MQTLTSSFTSFLTCFRLALRSMVTLCLEPSRACSMVSADIRTFFRAGFFTPLRSTTLIFRSSIYAQKESVIFSLLFRGHSSSVMLPEEHYLFVSLLHLGFGVVPLLIDLVDGGVKLLADFLLMHKETPKDDLPTALESYSVPFLYQKCC